ncbi:IS30 family transposase [Leuconostoc citreum]|uniref:IS30 family transposase n=1 Tax=Leuconostoc citreum TaxID=33964 RepID=UPI00200A36CB|nr:IS30 family transposase [Leuconostoc citreum]MCK8605773.1 IS30 family transposase [Leuconostoc citreum]
MSDEKQRKRKFKARMTENDRYMIEYLWNTEKMSQSDIARKLGRSQSSIARELNKGNTLDFDNLDRRTLLNMDIHARIKYSAQRAQFMTLQSQPTVGQGLKLTDDVKDMIEYWINVEHWTPEQIIAGKVLDIDISVSSIYNWERRGLIEIKKHKYHTKHTPKERQMIESRRAKQREIHRLREELKHKGELVRHSIYERSQVVDKRKQFAHWEIDLVLPSKMNNKRYLDTTAIMTFTERKTRFTALSLVKSKHTSDVLDAFKVFWEKYGKAVRTITADNGSEFISWDFLEHVQKDLGVKLYYATPSAPQQRGTNKNRNRKLRDWYPKGTSFKDVTQQQLDEVAFKMNNLPLTRALDGKRPLDVFDSEYKTMQRYRRAYEKRKLKMLEEKKASQDNHDSNNKQ